MRSSAAWASPTPRSCAERQAEAAFDNAGLKDILSKQFLRPRSEARWLTPAYYAARWKQNEELDGHPLGAFNDDKIPVPAG